MRVLPGGSILLLLWLLAVPGSSAETGSQVLPAGRVGLTITETAGLPRTHVPVMVTGETVLRITGAAAIDTRSLRLIPVGGQPVPLQVDEKDGTGLYQAVPNHHLDPDDEILWQVDLAPYAQQRYYLAYGPEALPDTPEDNGDVTLKENAPSGSHPYHLLLSNSVLQAGIQGNEQQVYDGRLKGCLARLSAGGTDLVTYGAPGMWGPTQAGVDWQRLPIVVARGPIRTTVAVVAEQVDRAFQREGGTWTVVEATRGTLKGQMYRYFSLYNHLPYLECREMYQVVKASRDFSASFVFPFRTAPVSPLERGDTLYGHFRLRGGDPGAPAAALGRQGCLDYLQFRRDLQPARHAGGPGFRCPVWALRAEP